MREPRSNPIRTIALWAGVALCTAPPVFADELRLDYRRPAKRDGVVFRSQPPAPPEALVLERIPVASPIALKHGGYQGRTGQPERAGRWAAFELARRIGVMEYRRAGFWMGLRSGISDPDVGGWDYLDGRRRGRVDPLAAEIGGDLGRAAALDAAPDIARTHVESQFVDLARDPLFRPDPTRPAFVAPSSGLESPRLRDVFADFPLPSRVYLTGHEAWRLYRSESFDAVFASDWRDPAAALRLWEHETGRTIRGRDEAEIVALHARFDRSFARHLGEAYDEILLPAYHDGFVDGWSHGAFLNGELDYRRGYHDGFNDAVADSSRAGFYRSYRALYHETYAAVFRDWSENPKPRIASVALVDENRDGVFEPGERLLADYELINLGGSDGTYEVELRGGPLTRTGHGEVLLPARRAVHDLRSLGARIGDLVRPRTRTAVQFVVADESREIPLYVSRPLELDRDSFHTHRDDLSGRIVVDLAVENRSTRGMDGTIEVIARSPHGRIDSIATESLPGQGGGNVSVALEGIGPIDLIAGQVSVEMTVRGEGVVQDTWTRHVPGTATDLSSRDLHLLLVDQSRRVGTSEAEIRAGRELLLRRLQADWTAAVSAWGNPYKGDYRRGSSQTALGDLVRLTATETPGAARPEVFAGLSTDVMGLAEELPGVHPFLRKYVKRLAKELP